MTKINVDYIFDNDHKKIGTVHIFQKKEADEVIFFVQERYRKTEQKNKNWRPYI